jgi:hypothetical protein
MAPSNRRRPAWILTVAAAYVGLPACADDDTSDADQSSDSGIDAAVPPGVDTGGRSVLDAAFRPPTSNQCLSVTDAGSRLRDRTASDPPPPPNPTGIIGFSIYPCGDSVVDASSKSLDAGPSSNGSVARSVKGP